MTTEEETKKTLNEADLANFTGTEQWYKHWLGPLYTDGVKYVADQAGAYWLIDEIVLAQHSKKVRNEAFQHWVLKVDLEHKRGTLTADDGNDNVIFSKVIEYTDFCLSQIRFYFTDNVILLPSEY